MLLYCRSLVHRKLQIRHLCARPIAIAADCPWNRDLPRPSATRALRLHHWCLLIQAKTIYRVYMHTGSQEWFDVFDRKQIYIASYDDLKENPAEFLLRIHEFLELPLTDPLETQELNSVHIKMAPIPCALQQKLAAKFEGPNRDLYSLLEADRGPNVERRTFQKFQFHCKHE